MEPVFKNALTRVPGIAADVPGNPPTSKNGTLIDDLLGEQQLLTPVAIFSRKHERHAVPARAKYIAT